MANSKLPCLSEISSFTREESFALSNEREAASTGLPLAVMFPETVMPWAYKLLLNESTIIKRVAVASYDLIEAAN